MAVITIRKVYVKKLLYGIILFTLAIIIFLFRKSTELIDDVDRKQRQEKIDEYIKTKSDFKACKQPNLPVYSPEMMQFVRDVKPIDCKTEEMEWVVCKNTKCKIQKEVMNRYGEISCSFTDQIRVNDFYVADGKTTYTNYSYTLKESDVVKVSCIAEIGRTWKGILTGIRFDESIWEQAGWQHVNNNSFKINVLMFGFDSLSRNTFIRKLPKSYKYLSEKLGAFVLQGYNIVGDGTPQALIPILTGKTELELPDTRKRMKDAHFVDVYPFIWNDFKENGYVTAFLEDMPKVGIFTYRLKGFDKVPTDHYMRTYYLAQQNDWFSKHQYCAGGLPKHQVMLNYIKDFFTVYRNRPKFLFGFHGQLSHDSYNLIGAADDDVEKFLQDLNNNGLLNDTILIFMSDHGHRFADIRNTIQGKQEERLPFFSFRFPPSFKDKYRHYFNNFVSNINTLTTPFDIYSTLKTVIDLNITKKSTLKERSISLFSKIPEERSCAHAYIESHWCACLEWKEVSLSHDIVKRLSNTLVSTINEYTSAHRNICAELSVLVVLWVLELKPNENLLKFKKNADMDGFVPDLSSDMPLTTNTYQIKAELVPGRSLFEASITHNLRNNSLKLKLSDISRTNMYGSQARCIEETYPHLRKFCYCKD